jgi:hypothetical protein
LNNAGTNAAFDLTVGPDGNALNGYEIWNISAAGNNDVALSQEQQLQVRQLRLLVRATLS